MVSALRLALTYCDENKLANESFLTRVALAKRLPSEQEAHLKSALELAHKHQAPEYRTRAVCTLAKHFPEKQRFYKIQSLLTNPNPSDEELRLMAQTFNGWPTASTIQDPSTRFNTLLTMALAEDDPKKADTLFRYAVETNSPNVESLDLLQKLAAQTAHLVSGFHFPDFERYTKHYIDTLKCFLPIDEKHFMQFFKEVLSANIDLAVHVATIVDISPSVDAKAALLVLESSKEKRSKDIETLVNKVKTNNDLLNNASITLRLEIVCKSSQLPQSLQLDFVLTARWIEALLKMGKQKEAIEPLKAFRSQVEEYLNSITVADPDLYRKRCSKLLKAASALAVYFPNHALELVKLALPRLANARSYIEDIEAIVHFACKHKFLKVACEHKSLKACIEDEITTTLKKHRAAHLERDDSMPTLIALAKAVQPLSIALAHTDLISEIFRTRISHPNRWSKSFVADLFNIPAFNRIRVGLYEEALAEDPQNIELMLCLANCSDDKKEEWLGRALDTFLKLKNPNRNLLGRILSAFAGTSL